VRIYTRLTFFLKTCYIRYNKMKILEKYLLKEVLGSSLSVLAIFMIILSSNTMLRLIEEASAGTFPTYLLFPIIFVKIIQYSIYIIPISLFFGIIISLGKLYNSTEMAVIASSGLSQVDLASSISKVIISTCLIVGFFSLYLTPAVTDYRYKLEHRLNSEEKIEEIRPGRFTSSQNGKATFFVDNAKNNKLNKIFFSSITNASTTVENSRTATYYTDSDLRRYIILRDGVITELLAPYKSNTRTTRYLEHGVQLGQDLPMYTNNKYDSMGTIQLFSIDGIKASAELQSRFMLPIATLVLGFAAIPLSYSSPRKGRYNKIFFGALVYFSYFIIMSIAEKMFLLNIVPIFLGLWWIHLLVILALYYIYVSDYKRIPSRK
jgi:lipopolysaccharide export system permease protein